MIDLNHTSDSEDDDDEYETGLSDGDDSYQVANPLNMMRTVNYTAQALFSTSFLHSRLPTRMLRQSVQNNSEPVISISIPNTREVFYLLYPLFNLMRGGRHCLVETQTEQSD